MCCEGKVRGMCCDGSSVRFEETSVAAPTCRFNNDSCLGGFPRLYHEIQVLLQQKPDAVLLNAGDSFQGTYWYTLLKWNVIQQFMNLLPHDAHAIGNHEFDDGPEGLAPYLSALKAPVVAANMDCSEEPSMQGLYVPHIVIERKGRKIGIIGLITVETETLSSPGKVKFTDPSQATEREVKALLDKGVDIIILLSHCGLEVDKQLAKDHGKDIDIIIGGHSHSLLWNGPSPSGEPVAAPYPVFVESSADTKHNVLIVQASAFTKYMGNLTVYFDAAGNYLAWEGGPIFLNRSIEEDASIKAQLAPYAKMVHDAENVVVGETKESMMASDCKSGECIIGDMITDSLVEYAKSKVKSELDIVAFIQRSNIKSSIHAGDITERSLFELMPYYDKVYSFELEGKQILKALERSVMNAQQTHPFRGPLVLLLSGLTVEYNTSLSEGQRVTSALVGDAKKPLDVHTYYQVIAPAFLYNGGDGYTMFKTGRRHLTTIGRDQDIVKSYIKKHTPLDIKKDSRIVIR